MTAASRLAYALLVLISGVRCNGFSFDIRSVAGVGTLSDCSAVRAGVTDFPSGAFVLDAVSFADGSEFSISPVLVLIVFRNSFGVSGETVPFDWSGISSAVGVRF